ncbi:GDSL lipase/esterase [Cercophora newfieldiana]|uniref:GDSL lipase/esterase n=1 Tax=Cercophora newfieldiana TaxID=92897 RepID=A0AA39Y433_9PEZI|nr:GDSL lipase/esterase [Cercophora newfieldiana]
MLLPLLLSGLTLAAAAAADRRPAGKQSFDILVTFGDSYTDNGRLGYYINNRGNPPPAGQLHTESLTTASGGITWPQFVAKDADAKLLDYAVSGATCSNKIVERFASFIGPTGRSYPAILDDQMPSFVADSAFRSLAPRTAENTVYAVWIGTNDLGAGAFLTDTQAAGATITDFVGCIWSVFDAIYKTGGRRFVLLNEAPLELSPLYATPANGGTLDSQFWGNKTQYNMTEYSSKIKQYTSGVNTMLEYGVPFQTVLKSRWPGATFDLFDVHGLLLDIIKTPQNFLDAPYNVTGYFRHCQATNNANCNDMTNLGPKSGFLWYDELHPSEKTDSIIAKHFIDVVDGSSKYGTRYSGGR